MMNLIHATAVGIDGVGVLLRGASGAGKSDLALRLIEGGARLVADDQVELDPSADGVWMRPPATIAGLIEVRGLGLVRLPYSQRVKLALVVDLVAAATIERLPQPASERFAEWEIPLLQLNPWETSAAAKVRLAVQVATGSIMALR
jgi:serine kinase of HPr protein (carbohydrate metabolism regulator)